MLSENGINTIWRQDTCYVSRLAAQETKQHRSTQIPFLLLFLLLSVFQVRRIAAVVALGTSILRFRAPVVVVARTRRHIPVNDAVITSRS